MMSGNAASLRVVLEQEGRDDVRAFVLANLRAFNRQRAEPPDFQPLILSACDGDELVAGLVGETGWRWLYVDLLWVAERYRGRGVGARLLHEAEREAVRRGARHVYLDTFDFQARPFYERFGYVLFGTLHDYPPGHTRFFLRKDLEVGAAATAADGDIEPTPG